MSEVTDLKKTLDETAIAMERAKAHLAAGVARREAFERVEWEHRAALARYEDAVRREERQRALEAHPEHEALRAEYDAHLAFVRGGYESTLHEPLATAATLLVDALIAAEPAEDVWREVQTQNERAIALTQRLSLRELGIPDNGNEEHLRYDAHAERLRTGANRVPGRVKTLMREALERACAKRGLSLPEVHSRLFILGLSKENENGR